MDYEAQQDTEADDKLMQIHIHRSTISCKQSFAILEDNESDFTLFIKGLYEGITRSTRGHF
jgi:hypothetical protein